MTTTPYHDPSLVTPEPQLADSRRNYIHNHNKAKQFEADCAIIVPLLDALWTEKIIQPFGFPQDDEHVMIWKDYLRVFKPQVLEEAIDLLATRLKEHERRYGSVLPNVAATLPTPEEQRKLPLIEMRERINAAAGVVNLRAFYRSLVHQLKREDDRKNPIQRRFHELIMIAVLEEVEGQAISFGIPKSDYEAAGLYLPADHRRLAERIGWIEKKANDEPGALGRISDSIDISRPIYGYTLTPKGVLALECLRGGFAVPFVAAIV